MTVLILNSSQRAQIESEGSIAYPNECCGAMLGRDEMIGEKKHRRVDRLVPLKNSFVDDEQFHRFSLDPLELMNLEKSAGQAGLSVLGFYHSHPDHPAKPSEYDRQHAWPFYSYAIVAIAKRKAVDLTSWQLDEVTEAFVSEEIRIQEIT